MIYWDVLYGDVSIKTITDVIIKLQLIKYFTYSSVRYSSIVILTKSRNTIEIKSSKNVKSYFKTFKFWNGF